MDDIESIRAEIFGSIAIHTIHIALSSAFAISSGEMAIYCDNKDALCKNEIITSDISFPCFFRLNIDIKLQIMRQQLHPINIQSIHIKGHQHNDGDFDTDKKTLSVKLNIEVDEKSKLFLKDHKGKMELQYKSPTFPVMRAFVSVNNTVKQNNMEHHIK